MITAAVVAGIQLVIFLISPVILSTYLESNEAESNSRSAAQVSNYFTTTFDELNRIVNYVYSDPVIINSFEVSKEKVEDFDFITDFNQKVARELGNLTVSNKLIETVDIYGANNLCYQHTPASLTINYNDRQIFDSLKKSGLLNYLLENENKPFYFDGSRYKGADPTADILIQNLSNRICFVKAVMQSSDIKGIILLVLKQDFAKYIVPDDASGASTFIFDSGGHVVWSDDNGEGYNVYMQVARQLNKTGRADAVQSNKSYLALMEIIQPYDFRLVKIIEKQRYIALLSSDYSALLLVLAACILAASVAAFLFSGSIFGPIREFSTFVKNGGDIPQKYSPGGRKRILWSLPLKTRLFCFLTTLFVLPMLLMTILAYSLSRDKLTQGLVGSMYADVEQTNENIDYSLKNFEQIGRQVVNSPVIQQYLYDNTYGPKLTGDDKLNLTGSLNSFNARNRDLVGMTLYDTSGYMLATTNTGVKADLLMADGGSLMKLVKANQSKVFYFNVGNDIYGTRDTTLAMTVLYSQSNEARWKIIGYFSMSVDSDLVSRMVGSLPKSSKDFAFIADGSGSYVYHTDASKIGKSAATDAAAGAALASDGVHQIKIGNQEYFAFTCTSGNTGWKTVAVLTAGSVTGPAQSFFALNLGLLLLLLAATFLISMAISAKISVHIDGLCSLMQEVQAGNTKVRMRYSGKDEIHYLVESFNGMVDRLNTLLEEVYTARIRENELLLLEKEAQINALQQQINPHFLYNTLDSIKWMAFRAGAGDISNMVSSLSTLLRGSIVGGKEVVTIAEELKYTECYLYIQKIRFREKLNINWACDPDVLQRKTIKFILQPLVENAIQHGLELKMGEGRLAITVCRAERGIEFSVTDDGCGISEEKLMEINEILISGRRLEADSIGICNVQQRLRLRYGGGYGLTIASKTGEGTCVRMTIPEIE